MNLTEYFPRVGDIFVKPSMIMEVFPRTDLYMFITGIDYGEIMGETGLRVWLKDKEGTIFVAPLSRVYKQDGVWHFKL